MIGRSKITQLTAVLYGFFFGSIFSGMALHIFSNAHAVVKCLIIGVFIFSFYLVGLWVSLQSELNKKIPTPSHELRRRTKEFYDSLNSQGRHYK